MKRNYVITISAIVIVLIFIGSAIYYLNRQDDEYVLDEQEVINTTDEISVVNNMKMAIANYDTMNPIITNNRDIVQIDKIIFEPLVNLTPDYKIQYELASSVTKNDDLTYTVKVDRSILWQNGTNLSARDVEFTIMRLKETNTTYSQNVAQVSSVEIIDEETAIIHLSSPVVFFEYNLTFPLVCASYYEGEDFFNSSKIPIGTGMYKIASIDQLNILLTRNDKWKKYKTNTPKTESITIKRYNAIGEGFNAFKLGGVDIIHTKMSNYTDYIGTIGNKKIYVGREYDFISLNCNNSILSDVNVRKAISFAIDKNNIVAGTLGNTKIVANTPLDYGSYLSSTEGLCTGNVEEAKRILAESGWVYDNSVWSKEIDGRITKLQLSLVVNNGNQTRINVANTIKKQLAEAGISITIRTVSDDIYHNYLNNKNYDMIITGVTNSVNPNLSYFYGEGNIANYHNQNVINEINNLDRLKDIIKEANNECPYIGLYRDIGTIILNENVGGEFNVVSFNLFYNFYNWYRQT